MVDTPRFTDVYLDAVLDAWGLAVEYTSASENTVFTADGTAISDFIGGYGSTLLGHNNPEIVAHVRKLLDDRVPVHAQMSRRPGADRVGALLNDIVQRELGGDEPYRVVFGNTGAEAVEIAMKHAVLNRAQRLAVLTDDLDHGFATVRAAVTAGAASVPPIVYALLELPPDSGIDTVIAEVTRRNAEILAEPPVFLALEKGFHGKLAGSVQLTHNPGFRAPFAGLGPRVRFVPPEDADALTGAFDELRGTVLDLVVTDGVVECADHDFPVVAGMLVEPVQGEGGINPLTLEYAGLVRALTEERRVPLIVDEIQSGCGRTGAFFASGRLGLGGDYVALAKSLGGGVAKLSVLLVRESHYRPEFELVHSSTFAQDGLATSVAAKVLEIMEAGGDFYRRVVERGERLRHALDEVAAEFPDVVREVRGVGLLAGFEFHDQSRSGSPLIAGQAAAGVLGYVVSGYLLRAHRLRLAPTASATNTLRVQPSVILSDQEIDRLAAGLRDVCLLLRNQDAAPLVRLAGASTVDYRGLHRPAAARHRASAVRRWRSSPASARRPYATSTRRWPMWTPRHSRSSCTATGSPPPCHHCRRP